MILVFTGQGKGKSSAAIGTIIRALGWKKKVVLIRFFKGWWKTGEAKTLKQLAKTTKLFEIKSFPVKAWIKNTTPEAKKAFNAAYKYSQTSIERKPFLVVLDEILVGLKMGLCENEDIVQLINLAKKGKVHLILTGRGWPKALTKHADLITELNQIKHPFEKSQRGQKGIDW